MSIPESMEFIRNVVSDSLNMADTKIVLGSVCEVSEQSNEAEICLSLVRCAQDMSGRDIQPLTREPTGFGRSAPPIALDIHVLFSFISPNYTSSLDHLSQVIDLFHENPIFDAGSSTGGHFAFPDSLAGLALIQEFMGYDELNQLWGIHGGLYLPSATYQVRIARASQ